jgi:hypothetical protein
LSGGAAPPGIASVIVKNIAVDKPTRDLKIEFICILSP